MDPEDIRFWLPPIEGKVPTPKTFIHTLTREQQADLHLATMEGVSEPPESLGPFLQDASHSFALLGRNSAFIRSGHISGKHNFKKCCLLFDGSRDEIYSRVREIVYMGEMVSLMGMPIGAWAIREFLEGHEFGVCPRFGDMPLRAELRIFSNGKIITHTQPYWPLKALTQGGAADAEAIHQKMTEASLAMAPIASTFALAAADAVNRAHGGGGSIRPGEEWSVDVLDTSQGPVVIDMARGDKSYRYCPSTGVQL